MSEEEQMFQRRHTAFEMIEHNRPLREHWVRRIFAILIDYLIVIITAGIVGFILGFDIGPFSLKINTILAIFSVFYASIMEWMYGATIGKMAMDLKVQSLMGHLDLYKTLLRNLSKVHGLILLVDTIIGMATEGDPRQRFLDRLAETTVVSTPKHRASEEKVGTESHGESENLPSPVNEPQEEGTGENQWA